MSEQCVDRGRIRAQATNEALYRTILDLYPCDVLFVHRDAEGIPSGERREEIAQSLLGVNARHVPVVPVRMTEAWLLADEMAIRLAAGNPNGRGELNLPSIRNLENLADPKKVLHAALTAASGLNARRRTSFRVHQRVRLIPTYIDDYSPLNVLPAFRQLQQDINAIAM